jgi:hypothetical protein
VTTDTKASRRAERIAAEQASFTTWTRRALAFELHRQRMSAQYRATSKSFARKCPGYAAQARFQLEAIDAEVARRVSEGWLHLTPLQYKLRSKNVKLNNGGFSSLSKAVAEDEEDPYNDWED